MEFHKFIVETLGLKGLIILLAFSFLGLILRQKMHYILKFILKLVFGLAIFALIYLLATNNVKNEPSKSSEEFHTTYTLNVDDYLALRNEPSSKTKELLRLYPDDENLKIKILDIIKSKYNTIWYQVQVKDKKGWVSGKYIKNDLGKYHVQTKYNNTLHVRKEPYEKAQDLGELSANEEHINVLIKQRNKSGEMWFKIDHCDTKGHRVIGWALGDYLKKDLTQ